MPRYLGFTISVLVFTLSLCVSANAQRCLKYGPTVTVAGTLRSQVFAGPPNYESIRRGDRKETAVILTLDAPICVTGGDTSDVLETPESGVRKIQLVVTKAAPWRTIRRLKNKRAIVTGTLFHGHSGYHQTDILIQVKTIRGTARK